MFADAGKYGAIETETIPPHEPVFLIRAQDSVALFALEAYAAAADTAGAPEDHVEGVGDRIQEFREWQARHPIKVPGT